MRAFGPRHIGGKSMEGMPHGWGLLLALRLADYGEFSRALDEMYLQNSENARLNALESAQGEKDAILQMLSLSEEADAQTVAQCCFRDWRRRIALRRLSRPFAIRTSFSA